MVTSSLLAATAILFSILTGISANAVCVGQEATAIALVGLHEGPNCSLVSLRGIQQQAAILAAAKTADNALSKDGMNFRLRVFDTCSDPREAVAATLRSLTVLPHACLQPPLFLGFVGPEDSASLQDVLKVTKVFSLNHAIPLRVDSTSNSKQGPLHVTSLTDTEQIQSALTLLQKLQWGKVTVMHTADSDSTQMASSLARRVCSTGAPIQLPEYGANVEEYNTIVESLAGEDSPVVILSGSSLPVTQFLRIAEHGAPAYLVISTTSGILPDLVSTVVTAPVLVMQYTSGKDTFESDLWEQYLHQRLLPVADMKSLMADVQDPTVTPMANAVRLYGAALSTARQARCQGRPGPCPKLTAITPDQWRNLLAVAMAPSDPSDPTSKRIRFRMDTPAKAELFLKLAPSELLTQVGHIEAGTLQITSEEEFALLPSAPHEDSNNTEGCWDGSSAPAPKTTLKSVVPEEPEADLTSSNVNQKKEIVMNTGTSSADSDAEFYEMVAYLSGITAAIVVVFLAGLFMVVRSFLPARKQRCSPPSSVSSVRTQ